MKKIMLRVKNLFFPPLQHLPLQNATEDILKQIQERVVTVFLRLCVLFGLLSVSVGTIASWHKQDWRSILTGNLSFLGILLLAVLPNLSSKIRTTTLIILAYAYLFFTLMAGVHEFMFVPLFAFVVMTTLLLGWREGGIAFLISLLTILIVHWQIVSGNIPVSLSLSSFAAPLSTILVPYTDWIFFAGIFIFTIWIYFDGFAIAWQREKKATTLLAEERDRLAKAFAREQALLEQLTQAHQREIELSRMKSQIITTVSHEFRTPLTVIGNSVELLTRYADSFDAKKQEAIHRRIDDSIYYLTELLQDASLVNTAHSQGFQANWVSIPFNGLGQRLKKDLLQETNEPTNVVIQFDKGDDTAVSLDYDFLYRAIFNFLNNALKYSPETSSIQVDMQRSDQLTVSVSDSGIGIAPDELQKIWELFYRGRNAADRRGLGLGLHLTKRLIQAMDGTVTAVSPGVNQGSTFTIHIPQTRR